MSAFRRSRLRQRLRDRGLGAFIGVGAANFRYLSGTPSAFLELSGMLTGTDMVIVPADEDKRSVLLVNEYSADEVQRGTDILDVRTFSNWTENRPLSEVADGSVPPLPRPEQFDFDEIMGLLKDVIGSLELGHHTVGADLTQMRHPTAVMMMASLAPANPVDATGLVYELRAIKDDAEIQSIRTAAGLFDIGVDACFDAARPGVGRHELESVFDAAVRDASSHNCEASFFFPHIGRTGSNTLAAGDVLKIDAGARVDGYWSDGCRHTHLGPATQNARQIHDALSQGFEAARNLLRPGVSMRRIYDAAVGAVRSHGLPGYSRGHVGHSIGLDNHQEEPPFIGPNDTVLLPGMVICLEVPFYPPDIGGFNLEDMFLITESGAECLTHATRELREI